MLPLSLNGLQPKACNSYYVLRSDVARQYFNESHERESLRPGLENASRYNSIPSALMALQVYMRKRTLALGATGTVCMYIGELKLIRVEEITEPGTTARRVLDHGEQAPEGATIKFAIVNLFTAKRDLQDAASFSYGQKDFETEIDANTYRIKQLGAGDVGYGIRRVAIGTTAPKVTRNEIVLA